MNESQEDKIARLERRLSQEVDKSWHRSEEEMHKYGYPPSLIKACSDEWYYLAKLRTGEFVCFTSAESCGPWVRLHVGSGCEDTSLGFGAHQGVFTADGSPSPAYDVWNSGFGRGFEVRVADIVWCLDGDS